MDEIFFRKSGRNIIMNHLIMSYVVFKILQTFQKAEEPRIMCREYNKIPNFLKKKVKKLSGPNFRPFLPDF